MVHETEDGEILFGEFRVGRFSEEQVEDVYLKEPFKESFFCQPTKVDALLESVGFVADEIEAFDSFVYVGAFE